MDCFIKKIFLDEIDKGNESVHGEFIKFSRGNFEDKYLIEAKKQKNGWVIKTSSEFANFLVRECLKKAPETLKVRGVIVCTVDICPDIKFEVKDVKKFMGTRKIVVGTEVNKMNLIELIDKYPRIFYALSFETPSCNLKIKEKSPKTGKPSTTGEKKPKANFCVLKTTDSEIVKNLIFDVPTFNEIRISHTINIKEVIIPQGEKDFEKIRLLAKRRGKIIRKINVDGKEIKSEKEFEA